MRPSTLPGLYRIPDKLAMLAGRVVLDSPKATIEVKSYARSLVHGIIRLVYFSGDRFTERAPRSGTSA